MLRRVGVCFDIDGVLIRGRRVLPGAPEALRAMQAAGVPYLFMTNGGGMLEEQKAADLEAKLGVPVKKEQIVLAHSPMRSLAHGGRLDGVEGVRPEGFADKRVMILGCRSEVEVARSYGFRKTVTPHAFCAQHPDLYPASKLRGLERDNAAKAHNDRFQDEPVEALLIMHDPVDWHLELQVCLDILCGRDPLSQHPEGAKWQTVPLFNSNEDFVYASTYPFPRLAQGAYLQTLGHLFSLTCGGAALEVGRFGKPHKVTFDFAREQLQRGAGELERIFMVGDNPHADILGANHAGDPWRSILLETGVYKRGEDTFAAHHQLPDVQAAVQHVLAVAEGRLEL